MALRRPDRCAACGRELAAGTVADWDPTRREATCTACLPAVVEGVAGASALREYERRRARREAHAREMLGGLGALIAK